MGRSLDVRHIFFSLWGRVHVSCTRQSVDEKVIRKLAFGATRRGSGGRTYTLTLYARRMTYRIGRLRSEAHAVKQHPSPQIYPFSCSRENARTNEFQVWQTLAAVLHMSNLGFDAVDSEQGEIAAISDRAVRRRGITIFTRASIVVHATTSYFRNGERGWK